jgi:hypothetical protein
MSVATTRMRRAEEGGDPDEHDAASENLRNTTRAAETALGAIGDLIQTQAAHIRYSERISERPAAPAVERVLADLQREGEAHPLLLAGFTEGQQAVLKPTLQAISLEVGRIGKERAALSIRALPGHSGAIPTYLWIDTEERPRF